MRVHCRVCHRVERWSDDGARRVQNAGGERRSQAPERDTFEVLAASVQGELGPVVAACPACGSPMVADEGGVRIPWTIDTSRGPVRFGADGSVGGPDGDTLDAARQTLAIAHPRELGLESPFVWWFRGALWVSMIAPVAVWLGAVFFVVLFLTRVGTSVPRP